MGNCIPKNQKKQKKEEENFLLAESDSECQLTVASSISITLSDSISLPPTPPTTPRTPTIVMSIPVQKKKVFSELVKL